jgi:prepilin-type N-terminal cleavage/methylation domain-containing protein
MKSGIKAFTLIELLTVIAIIGILAAIIIPAAGGVKTAANKAKTKAMFSQWSLAMDLFKSDYGYYPAIATSNNKINDASNFFAALTGKKHDGTDASDLRGNTRKLSFYAPAASDVILTGTTPKLTDAFGNTEFVVFTDTDGNGIISGSELSQLSVTSIDGVIVPVTDATFTTVTGVRTGVMFYSAGKGLVENDIVTSW